MAKEEFEKLITEVRETSNQLVEALDRSTKNKKADADYNKTALKDARKLSLKLDKLNKQFRKESTAF